jgi:hypothetical protein
MEKQTFWNWVAQFFTPYKSTIRVQMMLTMFFSFSVIYLMVESNTIDHTVIIMLLTASFAPKLIENFTPKK